MDFYRFNRHFGHGVFHDTLNREYSVKLIAKDDKTNIAALESSAFSAPVL